MTEHVEGLKSASDAAKQVIVLATGVVTISVTFWEKIQGGSATAAILLVAAWVGFLITICLALATIFAVTGNLNQRDQIALGELEAGSPLPNAMTANITRPAKLMIFSFVASLSLVATSASLRVVVREDKPTERAPTISIVQTSILR